VGSLAVVFLMTHLVLAIGSTAAKRQASGRIDQIKLLRQFINEAHYRRCSYS
jgi:hypothetical protein